jgi:hypothetical protein
MYAHVTLRESRILSRIMDTHRTHSKNFLYLQGVTGLVTGLVAVYVSTIYIHTQNTFYTLRESRVL